MVYHAWVRTRSSAGPVGVPPLVFIDVAYDARNCASVQPTARLSSSWALFEMLPLNRATPRLLSAAS